MERSKKLEFCIDYPENTEDYLDFYAFCKEIVRRWIERNDICIVNEFLTLFKTSPRDSIGCFLNEIGIFDICDEITLKWEQHQKNNILIFIYFFQNI